MVQWAVTLAGLLILAVLAGVPVIAWTAWRRRPKPQPVTLLVIAIATTAPLLIALGGTARVFVLFSGLEHDAADQKARVLAEGISEMMNCTAFAVIVAMAVCVGTIVVSRFKRRKEAG
jgi:hypothetical protein